MRCRSITSVLRAPPGGGSLRGGPDLRRRSGPSALKERLQAGRRARAPGPAVLKTQGSSRPGE